MQSSPSLADFMAKLEDGVQGPADAISILQECASTKGSTLDLQQMQLTDSDFELIAAHFESVASHVTTLNVFMNELTQLPDSIGVLSNLKSLQAGCNPLQSISSSLFPRLSSISELDVGFSESLSSLPDLFSHLPNLQVLDAGNNRLASLPPSLFTCSKLEQLNVYGNCLKSLPSSIGSLQNLRVLNVGRNQISSIPSEVGQCSALVALHVYENCLSSLPSSISTLSNLKTLTAHSNEHLPLLPRHVRASTEGVKASAAFYASLSKSTAATNAQ